MTIVSLDTKCDEPNYDLNGSDALLYYLGSLGMSGVTFGPSYERTTLP
jgi:hypothetical protein